jgi:imidazoleglycerol-phosphate dehydratase
MSKATSGVRYAEIERETSETSVRVVLDLDGGTRRDVSTGVGFFDHMLEIFAFHGYFDLGITVEGDLHIDDHHTLEDVGIVLGRAVREALGSAAIEGCAESTVPADDALVRAVLEISGKSSAYVDLPFKRDQIGSMSTESILEFFKAFALNSGLTIHITKLAGNNDHHLCEAAFKAIGRAFRQAIQPIDRRSPITSKSKLD